MGFDCGSGARSSLQTNTTHHLIVSGFLNEFLSLLMVDYLCDISDDEPIQSPHHVRFGMLAWETTIDVSLFRVLGQKPPTLADPMQLADRFVTQTHWSAREVSGCACGNSR